MTSSELVRDACPLIRDLGWRFYFAPATVARGSDLGLETFEFYFLGRGGVLGNVDSRVIASAFGYFNPDTVATMWDAGVKRVEPRVAAKAYMDCCAEFGREHLSGLSNLDSFCESLEVVNDSADPAGLALYAGISAERLAEDKPARVMQLVAVLREFRGSAHLVALVASGVSPKVAHYVHRPNDMAMFGWSTDDIPLVSADDVKRLENAEVLTDQIVMPAYSALDATQGASLMDGLRAMQAVLAPTG